MMSSATAATGVEDWVDGDDEVGAGEVVAFVGVVEVDPSVGVGEVVPSVGVGEVVPSVGVVVVG